MRMKQLVKSKLQLYSGPPYYKGDEGAGFKSQPGHISDLKTGILEATLSDPWCYGISAKTDWSSLSTFFCVPSYISGVTIF